MKQLRKVLLHKVWKQWTSHNEREWLSCKCSAQ